MTDWVELICCVPLGFRTGEKSIRQLFEPALAHLDDRATFLAAINRWLREHPDLIHAWEAYCTDKRTGRGPYFDLWPAIIASIIFRPLRPMMSVTTERT
jgi:hypothetical protein